MSACELVGVSTNLAMKIIVKPRWMIMWPSTRAKFVLLLANAAVALNVAVLCHRCLITTSDRDLSRPLTTASVDFRVNHDIGCQSAGSCTCRCGCVAGGLTTPTLLLRSLQCIRWHDGTQADQASTGTELEEADDVWKAAGSKICKTPTIRPVDQFKRLRDH